MECLFDKAQFQMLGKSEKYCCFAGIPDDFKCNIDWLEEFVKDMKQKCIYCSKTRGDHLSKMRCPEHKG